MWNALNKDLMDSITLSPFLAQSSQQIDPYRLWVKGLKRKVNYLSIRPTNLIYRLE